MCWWCICFVRYFFPFLFGRGEGRGERVMFEFGAESMVLAAFLKN